MLHHASKRTTAYASRLTFASSVGLPCTSLHLRYSSTESAGSTPSHGVAVLGGGITGLTSAYYLSKHLPNQTITIYEASDRLGGWLSSSRVPVKDGTVVFEAGPRSLRPASNGILSCRLLQELDLANDAIFPQKSSPAACNRYIYYPDHLVRMPHPNHGWSENLSNFFREDLFRGLVWPFLFEVTKRPRSPDVRDESVGDFFSRRLSSVHVDRLISAILHGIYAGDAWQLSAKSMFPQQWRDEVQSNSVIAGFLTTQSEGQQVTSRDLEFSRAMRDFQWDPLLKATLKNSSVFTLKDGLGALSDRLVHVLAERGNVKFKASTPVKSIALSKESNGVVITPQNDEAPETYAQIVSALSPAHLNQITSGRSTPLVPHIPTVTVMTINMFFRSSNLHPPGFGYLIPQATSFEENPERALGVVFDDALSPTPADVDPRNWHIENAEQLQAARESGRLVNINDFAWYNMPNQPNSQDQLAQAGTKMTVMLGGHWWDGWPAYPDEKEGLALARSLVERHLHIKEAPEAWQVNLQKDCIPQYTVGHEDRLKTAHNNIWADFKGRLRVAGNWMSGVGVNDCIRSAWDVAESLRLGRSGTGLEHIGITTFERIK